MNNRLCKKIAIFISAVMLISAFHVNDLYAQDSEGDLQKGSMPDVEMSNAENIERNSKVNENNVSVGNSNIVKHDNVSDVSEGEMLKGADTDELQSAGEGLTPEEAEKQDMANSWRFKNGERIIQDSSMLNARSARAITPWTNIDGKFYNSKGDIIEGVVAKGIDISQWNGNVDWATVKKTDVNYAILRCGFGMDQSDQDDTKWKQNADACTKNDIPFGVYIYSYADTVERAISEAQHVLRLVKGYKLTYPIYYDLEETSVRKSVSKSGIAKIAKAFCDTIEAAGYRVGIYANTDWFENYLTDPVFDNWTRWVAQWNYECTYSGTYKMWQCTDNGQVNGINGAVDLNMDFGTVDSKRLVVKDGKTYCYSGNTQLFGEQKVNGHWMYFSTETGEMQKGLIKLAEKTVCYDENGWMVYGEKKVDGHWRYFDTYTGAMQTGLVNLSEKTVCYNEDGWMVYGKYTINGKNYYFDTYTGAMQTGLVNLDEGKIFCFGTDGVQLFDEQKVEGKWRYFDKQNQGAMVISDFVDLGNKVVYYDETGGMVYGEKKADGHWRYFDTYTGAMKTGFVNLPGKTVYYDKQGKMLYREQKINGKWYAFNEITGAMVCNGYYGNYYYGANGVRVN